MLLSEFSQALDINPCPRTVFCNNCEVIHMWGNILNAGENVEDKDEYGFTGSFFKKIAYYYRWQYQNAIDEDAENTKIKYWWNKFEQSNMVKILMKQSDRLVV